MCNLNIFIKTEEENNKKDFINFFTTATATSFITNPDGEGVYFSNSDNLIKSKNKIAIFNNLEDLRRSNFIISHQRLATHGKTYEFTQPFNSKNFIFVHNGILSDFVKDNDKSDSFNFFTDFLKEFSTNNYKTREHKILYALKKLLKKTYGSFSIGLFDKDKKILYYMKNYQTNINFFRGKNKDFLYITTKATNEDFLNFYDSNYKEFKIENNKIYRIYLNKKKVLIKPLIGIESKSYYYTKTKAISKQKKINFYSRPKTRKVINFFKDYNGLDLCVYDNLTDFKEFTGFFKSVNKRKCNKCKELTYNRHINKNAVFCDRCIDLQRINLIDKRILKTNDYLSYV